MDRGAWWATVHGVTKSWTKLTKTHAHAYIYVCVYMCIYIHNMFFQSKKITFLLSVQLSSVTQSCPTLYGPMDCSTPGFPVHHQLPELAQTHVHQVGDVGPFRLSVLYKEIQPVHPEGDQP